MNFAIFCVTSGLYSSLQACSCMSERMRSGDLLLIVTGILTWDEEGDVGWVRQAMILSEKQHYVRSVCNTMYWDKEGGGGSAGFGRPWTWVKHTHTYCLYATLRTGMRRGGGRLSQTGHEPEWKTHTRTVCKQHYVLGWGGGDRLGQTGLEPEWKNTHTYCLYATLCTGMRRGRSAESDRPWIWVKNTHTYCLYWTLRTGMRRGRSVESDRPWTWVKNTHTYCLYATLRIGIRRGRSAGSDRPWSLMKHTHTYRLYATLCTGMRRGWRLSEAGHDPEWKTTLCIVCMQHYVRSICNTMYRFNATLCTVCMQHHVLCASNNI